MAIISNFGRRAGTLAFWAVPPLVALLLYWPGLTSWFQKDDFVWLGLRHSVESWRDLRRALFAPMAQGTIRTLSERAFFMSFSAVFGLNPLPFRFCAFLTHAGSLTVLSSVCSRLTGSRAAGFWAAILWTVNGALAVALSWTSLYSQLLCSFFFLLSFWLLLRYVETGERRFYLAQCATFVLGFGVSELNVVYPALAAVFALCWARPILGKVMPLFVISAVYTVVHIAVAPLPAGGFYKLYWDSSVISTLWTYWKWALGPSRLILLNLPPSFFRSALTVLLTVGMAGFLLSKLRRRQWIAAFFAAWFVIVLAPLLPLRDHISDYYLTIPLIGLAMGGGWALVSGWHAGPFGRIAALPLLAIYLSVSVAVARVGTQSFYDRSKEIQKLVLGVADLSRSRPEKMVLLKGVNAEMFWSAVYHRPFGLFGIREVYLVPEDERTFARDPQLGEVRKFIIAPVALKEALDEHRAVVYDVRGGHVRDITAAYANSLTFPPLP